MGLRPYQREACAAAWRSLQTRPTLLQSPTGTGKTVMYLAVAERAVQEVAGPVITVCPTDEILSQMARTFLAAGWLVQIDKAERYAQPSQAFVDAADGAKVAIVASQGTLQLRDRIERYPKEGYALFGQEECHHSVAPTWLGVRDYFSSNPCLGLSATPERNGMAKLWEEVRAFRGGLMEAIEQGWLVPFSHHYASGMSQRDYERLKDEDPAEVGKALPAAIATLQEALGARQGIAFWPRTLAAKQAAKFLRSLPEEISARALVGAMPREERTLALRQYVAGTLRVLNLCQVGVEGLDVPPAAVLAIYQQTKIRARVAQMVGRVLRPEASCLAGLDEALPEERRWAIERSSKPSAFVLSIAPPDAVDGWETPGALLWGHLPEPVLIDIDRRQRQGKDLETARREALAAEEDRAKEREAKRQEYEARLAAAAPARAQAVAEARPYELRDPAEVARDTRRKRLVEAWKRWRNRANAETLTMHRLHDSERKERLATSAQASAIAKLVAEYLREPSPRDGHGRVGAEVLTWDRKTASKAQHALRMMCGHGVRQKQRAG